MKKRFLCFILALTLCIGMCPMGAWATEGDTTTPGTGDGGNTGNPSQTTNGGPLGKDQIVEGLAVRFSDDYKEEFSNLTYNGTNRTVKPDLDNGDFDFWLGETKYSKPTDPLLAATVAEADISWYAGSSSTSGTHLENPPVNAGEYTLVATVTLTLSEEVLVNPDDATAGTTTKPVGTKRLLTNDFTFSIAPREVVPQITGTISKLYDGTTTYTPPENEASPVTLESGVLQADIGKVSVTVGSYAFGGINANETTPYSVTASGLALTGDASANYVLSTTEVEGTGRITKAPVPSSARSTTIVVRNNREHIYTYNLTNLLPALPSGQFYGNDATNKATFVRGDVQISYEAFCKKDDIKLEGSILTIPINKASQTVSLNVGTIKVTVQTDNFQDFDCTINLVSANKTQVKIGNLTPVRVPYDGEQEIGYTGTPTFSPMDSTSNEEIEGLSEENFVYRYESTSLSDTKYGPSSTPPTSPGVYELTISLNSEDYTAEEKLTFTITKAKVTITAKTREVNVDDPIPTLKNPKLGEDYTVSGLAAGDELRRPPTMKYKTVADAIMEGEFDILIDGAEVPNQTNYDPAIEYVPGKLIVTSLTNKQDNPFSDVSEHAWYVTAVKYVYNMGLMNGITDTLFGPTRALTRGQVVTILYRLDNEPPVWQTMPFTDLAPNAYYVNAVRWASANRIVNGYGDGRFGPDDVLTREQLAIILYNFSQYYGKTPSRFGSLDAFVDAPSTSSSSYRPLQWACGEGLIQGTGSNTLSPKGRALRAQVAVILMRYCSNVLELEEPKPAE